MAVSIVGLRHADSSVRGINVCARFLKLRQFVVGEQAGHDCWFWLPVSVGLVRVGSIYKASVIDFLHLGSSLSVRSFSSRCRVHSVNGRILHHVGSSLSIRQFWSTRLRVFR